MRKSKVLLVEDDLDVSLGLQLRMQSLGFQVNTAEDALYAINSAVNDVPDVIILDINLPDGDGLSVAEQLLEDSSTADIPVVFITASKEPKFRERAANLSAVAFLEKPFNSSELLDAIDLSTCRAQSFKPFI